MGLWWNMELVLDQHLFDTWPSTKKKQKNERDNIDQIINEPTIAGKQTAKWNFQNRDWLKLSSVFLLFVFIWCFVIYNMMEKAQKPKQEMCCLLLLLLFELNRSTYTIIQCCHMKISFILVKKVYRMVLN